MVSKFDRWSRDGMPSGEEMMRIQRGIDDTMREIVANRNIPTSASMIPDRQRASEEPPRAASGGTAPLTQAYVKEVDAVAEGFARADRVAAVRQMMETAEIERRWESRNNSAPKVKSEYDVLKRYDQSTPSLHGRNDD